MDFGIAKLRASPSQSQRNLLSLEKQFGDIDKLTAGVPNPNYLKQNKTLRSVAFWCLLKHFAHEALRVLALKQKR